jgi:hypothetical protein
MKMKFYNECKEVPENARKNILGGRLKGKTEIKPQWRIKKLTELFGPIGFGWKIKTIKEETINCDNGEIVYFVDIELFIKNNDEWSQGIEGSGGAKIISQEKGGLYVDDEAKKKAKTDAFGKACQMLGIGADVYWDSDTSKYDQKNGTKNRNNLTIRKIKNIVYIASDKDEKKAKEILEDATEFKNEKGEMVGKVSDITKLDYFKDTRINCIYGKLQKKYPEIADKVKKHLG